MRHRIFCRKVAIEGIGNDSRIRNRDRGKREVSRTHRSPRSPINERHAYTFHRHRSLHDNRHSRRFRRDDTQPIPIVEIALENGANRIARHPNRRLHHDVEASGSGKICDWRDDAGSGLPRGYYMTMPADLIHDQSRQHHEQKPEKNEG